MNKIAIIFGKITQKLLRLLGKGGGTLPGIVALKIDKNFLKKLSYPKDIILVTDMLKKVKKEIKLCDVIYNNVPKLKQQIREVEDKEQEKEIKQKKKMRNYEL